MLALLFHFKLAKVMATCMVKTKAVQSCLAFCDPVDDTANGILQARIRE